MRKKKRNMNEPIISPFTIYLIDEIDGLAHLCFVMAIVAGFMTILCSAVRFGSDWERGEREHCEKLMKKWFIAFIVFALGATFLPSQETSYKMLAANYITPANIEKGTDTVKSSMDYLADTIIRIEKEGKRSE